MRIRQVGAGTFLAVGQTDMTKLIVVFRVFANVPKNCLGTELELFSKQRVFIMKAFYEANVDIPITLTELDMDLLFFVCGRPFCTLAEHRVFPYLSDHNTFMRHSCLPCCSVTNRP